MRIQTMTTEYDQDEDRIRLATVDANKLLHAFWLTRRLSERLVPALVHGLNIEADKQQLPPPEVKAAQVYAQLAARIARKPAQPVRVDVNSSQSLVHEIRVKTAENGIRIIELDCRERETAELVMKPAELRQWLEVLHLAFQKAQWRHDIWPEWLQAPKQNK